MSHCNKRVKIQRRLMKASFSKEFADNVSRALYAQRGDAEYKSLTAETEKSKGGKAKKPLLFNATVEKNCGFDAAKAILWDDSDSAELKMINRMIDANVDAINAKVEIHTNSFTTRGQNWLGCQGRVAADWVQTETDFGIDDFVDFCKGGFSPWLVSVRVDAPRWGPSSMPLMGLECTI
eukprot:1789705-Pyramimonas_sp.AAC.1